MKEELAALKADVTSYTIEEAEERGGCLVLKVRYHHPDGRAQKGCTFEGCKVMVFIATMKDALLWREIDPHFQEEADRKATPKHKAPGPIARFPASGVGWSDALQYAESK